MPTRPYNNYKQPKKPWLPQPISAGPSAGKPGSTPPPNPNVNVVSPEVTVPEGGSGLLFPDINISAQQNVEAMLTIEDVDALTWFSPLPSGLVATFDSAIIETAAPMSPAALQVALRDLKVTGVTAPGPIFVEISVNAGAGNSTSSVLVNISAP